MGLSVQRYIETKESEKQLKISGHYATIEMKCIRNSRKKLGYPDYSSVWVQKDPEKDTWYCIKSPFIITWNK